MAIYAYETNKDSIQKTATAIANEVERNMMRWQYFADKLNTFTPEELTALGLSADYQTYLGSMKVALWNIVLKYKNQAPLDSSDPSYFVKLFAQTAVI